MYRLATVSPEGVTWTLRRNCSVTPRQLGGLYLLLSGVSLGVASFFWSHGAWMVMPFSLLELLAVAVAFMVYARHAADGELISVRQGRLVVELEEAGSLHRDEFAGYTVRVDSPDHRRRLVSVRSGSRSLEIGRFIRAEMRPVLAQELRRALGDL